MDDLERPPLDPRVYEQIEILLHSVDQRHWPLIAAMRIRRVIPRDEPIPPQLPHHLINQLQWYASVLLKTEADQYNQFRNDERYQGWLSKLSERIVDRVLKFFDRIDEANWDDSLAHHGVTRLQIIFAVQGTLHELTHPYTGGIARIPNREELASARERVPTQATVKASLNDRETLRDSYLATFPDVKILDVCWAAGQRYSEWKRWLRGVLKNGSAADKSFRAILTSRKSPQEYRRQPRPSGWK